MPTHPRLATRNKDTKTLTFDAYHLRKSIADQLVENKITIYDMSIKSLTALARLQGEAAIEDGYSILFTHSTKTAIIHYS